MDDGDDEVMFGFCLPGRYSLVFINKEHQLDSGVDLFFKRFFGNLFLMCGSDREEYAQNFNLLLGRLGKPATYHFSEYFRISYLWLLRVLTLCFIIFSS